MTMATFFASETLRVTIIAANIGQAMVNLKLWVSKSSSVHRQLHGGRGLNSQSLACESHTLPLGYQATIGPKYLIISKLNSTFKIRELLVVHSDGPILKKPRLIKVQTNRFAEFCTRFFLFRCDRAFKTPET